LLSCLSLQYVNERWYGEGLTVLPSSVVVLPYKGLVNRLKSFLLSSVLGMQR